LSLPTSVTFELLLGFQTITCNINHSGFIRPIRLLLPIFQHFTRSPAVSAEDAQFPPANAINAFLNVN